MLKKISIISMSLLLTASSIFACMVAPKPIVNGKSQDKSHVYSLKLSGEMIISVAGKELWNVKLKNYSQYFDKVYLIDGGNKVVHVKGNHGVNSIEDVAITTHTKKGDVSTFTVKEFTKKLEPGSETIVGKDGVKKVLRMSTDPRFRWMKKINKVDNKGISILNAQGEKRNAQWTEA
jgi:hypothetical protein